MLRAAASKAGSERPRRKGPRSTTAPSAVSSLNVTPPIRAPPEMTALEVSAAFADQHVFPFGYDVFEFGNGAATVFERRLLGFDR